MTLSQEITALARDLAEAIGRDWSDCGTYERESFRDEARRQMCGWIAAPNTEQSTDEAKQ